MAKDKLVTSGYCLILAANFLLYFAFYLILPVLPFYLTEVFHTGNAAVGVILSCYTIASLCIRPFSGYLLDTLARKPLYLVAYFIFITIFAGYMLAGVLSLFIMLRVVHGLAFGMVTVAGNTIVIDITLPPMLRSIPLFPLAAAPRKTASPTPPIRSPSYWASRWNIMWGSI